MDKSRNLMKLILIHVILIVDINITTGSEDFGRGKYDYIKRNTEEYYELLKESEDCAKGGDSSCRMHYAHLLISLKEDNGESIKYADDEVVYILRSSLHYPYNCDDETDRENLAFCDLTSRFIMSTISKFYRDGKYGMPKDSNLQECWELSSTREYMKCEYLELQKLGYIPRGLKPPGFR